MPTLTTERLVDLFTPRETQNTILSRIPKYLYNIRRILLEKKLEQTLDILRVNYWDVLTNIISALPKNNTPVSILARLRKMEAVDNRRQSLLRGYLTNLYVIMRNLRDIESRVENTIEYEELIYD